MTSATADPASSRPIGLPPATLPRRIDSSIHENQRSKQPERQHGSRHRIAETCDIHAGRKDRVLAISQCSHRREADRQRNHRGDRRERNGRERVTYQARVEAHEQPARDHFMQQISGRQQKAEHDRNRAADGCNPSLPARQSRCAAAGADPAPKQRSCGCGDRRARARSARRRPASIRHAICAAPAGCRD